MIAFARRVLGPALVVSTLLASAPARAAVLDRVGVYADVWRASVDGTSRIDGPASGSPYDLSGDAGLEGSTDAFELGAWFHPLGPHRVRVSAMTLGAEGSATLARALTTGDLTIPAGSDVTSTLDTRLYEAQYAYAFVNLDVINVAVLGGVDWLDADTALAFTGGRSAAHLSGGIPVVGMTAQVQPLGFLRVYGDFNFANWNVGGLDSEVFDLRLRAEFYVAHVFGLGIGYRGLKLRVEDPGAGLLDTRMRGFQLYVLLRF